MYYNGSSYGFEQAYLTNYSVNCAVGSIPKVSANLITFQEMTSGYDISGAATSHNAIDIPTQGSISITCDGSTSNRVVGFDYSMGINRRPDHHEAVSLFTQVRTISPIVFNAQVQIDVDDIFMKDSEDTFGNYLQIDSGVLTFTINGRGGGSIQSLTVPNATLVGENLTQTNNGSLTLIRNYVGRLLV
jgi:hypothetical protein